MPCTRMPEWSRADAIRDGKECLYTRREAVEARLVCGVTRRSILQTLRGLTYLISPITYRMVWQRDKRDGLGALSYGGRGEWSVLDVGHAGSNPNSPSLVSEVHQ
ncbi:hypothetical protein NDU88_000439 [Pleurodeles waltl]|uniref:Uncharacterized protein n=1 Tax=Pleurodeles waltl TaxID=8319 RepID=A0AAV7N836_PLEWA|nr:hypothetical protein NDU88_000439 [Pleurodeles waltl]